MSNPGNKVDLDDYNPFDGKTQIQSPAVMNPTEDLPPAEIPAPQIVQQPKVSTADFQVGFHWSLSYFIFYESSICNWYLCHVHNWQLTLNVWETLSFTCSKWNIDEIFGFKFHLSYTATYFYWNPSMLKTCNFCDTNVLNLSFWTEIFPFKGKLTFRMEVFQIIFSRPLFISICRPKIVILDSYPILTR